MDTGERKGWMEIISVDDLDSHMAAIGQAEANAGIVKQMFKDNPLHPNSRLLVAGCGTGQLFDYIQPSDLGDNLQLVLTDINPLFITKTRERLQRFSGIDYQTRVDDIEETKMKGVYDGVLLVLVLQHVEWKKALASVIGLNPNKLYIIEQEQDQNEHTVTKSRKLSDALRRYAEVANPKLVQRQELTDFLQMQGYQVKGKYEQKVPDNKTMYGFVFGK